MSGFTEEEKFLNTLAKDSFLSLWSWPNLFRDQGEVKNGGDGKEICDLIVVFGNDVLLFSDKKIVFNNQKDVDIAWTRWARKAISESLKQVNGARRWIKRFPNRIFTDNKCTQKIPIEFPIGSNVRFHNIVVCHGIEDALERNLGKPSFLFDNTIISNQHWDRSNTVPFTLGKISSDSFVHVFNEATVELIMKEFDTTKDFISYLTQREILFNSPQKITLRSEVDILQLYYRNFDENKSLYNILSAPELQKEIVAVDYGGIDSLLAHPQYIAKKSADDISYFWDDLIQCFSYHILNKSIEYKNWEETSEIEPKIRILASTGRFERRILSNAFISFYEKATPGKRGTRFAVAPSDSNTAYVFLLLPFQNGRYTFDSRNDYLKIRRQMLEDYCLINKLKNENLKTIIGIAAKTRDNNSILNSSFFDEGQDICVIDVSSWNDDDYKYAEEAYQLYSDEGFLSKQQEISRKHTDFPNVPHNMSVFGGKLKGSDRNKPCFCGSGKKAKRCCGR